MNGFDTSSAYLYHFDRRNSTNGHIYRGYDWKDQILEKITTAHLSIQEIHRDSLIKMLNLISPGTKNSIEGLTDAQVLEMLRYCDKLYADTMKIKHQ